MYTLDSIPDTIPDTIPDSTPDRIPDNVQDCTPDSFKTVQRQIKVSAPDIILHSTTTSRDFYQSLKYISLYFSKQTKTYTFYFILFHFLSSHFF